MSQPSEGPIIWAAERSSQAQALLSFFPSVQIFPSINPTTVLPAEVEVAAAPTAMRAPPNLLVDASCARWADSALPCRGFRSTLRCSRLCRPLQLQRCCSCASGDRDVSAEMLCWPLPFLRSTEKPIHRAPRRMHPSGWITWATRSFALNLNTTRATIHIAAPTPPLFAIFRKQVNADQLTAFLPLPAEQKGHRQYWPRFLSDRPVDDSAASLADRRPGQTGCVPERVPL